MFYFKNVFRQWFSKYCLCFKIKTPSTSPSTQNSAESITRTPTNSRMRDTATDLSLPHDDTDTSTVVTGCHKNDVELVEKTAVGIRDHLDGNNDRSLVSCTWNNSVTATGSVSLPSARGIVDRPTIPSLVSESPSDDTSPEQLSTALLSHQQFQSDRKESTAATTDFDTHITIDSVTPTIDVAPCQPPHIQDLPCPFDRHDTTQLVPITQLNFTCLHPSVVTRSDMRTVSLEDPDEESADTLEYILVLEELINNN